MEDVVFITGNQNKADYLAKYLGHPVEHIKLDLDEIQSLDLHEIVKHKVHQAYEKIGRPVLAEDVSLEFAALGKLPGTFIKWFEIELGLPKLCSLLDGRGRGAVARCAFGYFDGKEEKYFEGGLPGTIAEKPTGVGGYGFDPIFIPEGYIVTRAELSEADDQKTYLQMKPFEQVRNFLESRK